MSEAAPNLEDWIGSSETARDTISPRVAEGMAATLDWEHAPQAGDPLPPAWHLAFFNPAALQSALGPDGHPARGGFLPPVPLPRRMYASGTFTFHQPLRIGEAAARRSEVMAVEQKTGRTGPLVFVTVRHTITGGAGVALTDDQHIVYREAAAPGAALGRGEAAPAEPVWQRMLTPDPVMLFRYSALTFNGHRIHYDYPYVTQVEGYPDLIVHGPLTATLLLDLARRSVPDRSIARFAFRAKRPVFANRPLTVAGRPEGDGARLWALDHEGWLTMEAEVAFAAA
ncbi:MAG: acyl-CoA dehydrogenase [Rhodospirillaceae bacterium]|nr:acyl-CoA dehydrogenase [Rhodospirillaceae bacterium]